MKKTLIALSILLPVAANAEFWTGNKWLSNMESSDLGANMMALGYTAGVVDALGGITTCPPPDVTIRQVADMTRRLLIEEPSLRHKSADQFINYATSQAWPCKRKDSGKEPPSSSQRSL